MVSPALLNLIATAALAAALPQPRAAVAQDAEPADVISTRTDIQLRMTVPVHIGEAGPFRFMIDTGAQNTVLGETLADRLKLPEGKSVTLSGLAGTRAVRTVTIDELVLGKRSYYSLTAPLLEEHNIGADGIVGVDSLQGQRVLIDFRADTMTIDDKRNFGKEDGYDIVVVARRKSGQLIMTDARIDGVNVNVVIDTGAEGSIGNLALLQAMGKRGAALTQTILTSVTGQETPAQIAYARRLTIHGMEIQNVAVAFADAPPFRSLGLDKRPALFLGMRELRVFRRIAIDFPSRKVFFQIPSDLRQADPFGF